MFNFKKILNLGFSDYQLKRSEYARKNVENYPPLGILYEIREWITEEYNLFLEINLDTDLLYFWKAINTKTGEEENRTTDGFDSSELALIDGIENIIKENIKN